MKIDEFHKYLISNNIILENQAPYYVRWVERFLQFCRAQKTIFSGLRHVMHFWHTWAEATKNGKSSRSNLT